MRLCARRFGHRRYRRAHGPLDAGADIRFPAFSERLCVQQFLGFSLIHFHDIPNAADFRRFRSERRKIVP
jgi:hypothetical protein